MKVYLMNNITSITSLIFLMIFIKFLIDSRYLSRLYNSNYNRYKIGSSTFYNVSITIGFAITSLLAVYTRSFIVIIVSFPLYVLIVYSLYSEKNKLFKIRLSSILLILFYLLIIYYDKFR